MLPMGLEYLPTFALNLYGKCREQNSTYGELLYLFLDFQNHPGIPHEFWCLIGIVLGSPTTFSAGVWMSTI